MYIENTFTTSHIKVVADIVISQLNKLMQDRREFTRYKGGGEGRVDTESVGGRSKTWELESARLGDWGWVGEGKVESERGGENKVEWIRGDSGGLEV